MDLRAIYEYMHGKSVLVDGQTYPIGSDGYVRDVPDHAAALLLQNWRGWEVLGPTEPLMPTDASGQPAYISVPQSPTEAIDAPPPVPDEAGSERNLQVAGPILRAMVDAQFETAPPSHAPKATRRGRPRKGSPL